MTNDTDQPKKPPPNRKVKVSKEKIRQIGSFAPLNESHCILNSSSLVAQVELETGVAGLVHLHFFVLLSIFYDSDRKFLKNQRIKNKE